VTPWIDIGVNSAHAPIASAVPEVLKRARAAGVHGALLTGTCLASSTLVHEQAQAAGPGYGATAGVHPHDAKDAPADLEQQLRQRLEAPAVCAVGETGLDFNRDYSPRATQERVFTVQLALAAETGLPLFLHERDAAARFQACFAPFAGQVRGVLHCFTGDPAMLAWGLAQGLYFGITGWVCDERRGEALRAAVREIPEDRLLLETDAPFLVPRTLRPRPRHNEPAYLPVVADAVAALRGLSRQALAARCLANTVALFGPRLSPAPEETRAPQEEKKAPEAPDP